MYCHFSQIESYVVWSFRKTTILKYPLFRLIVGIEEDLRVKLYREWTREKVRHGLLTFLKKTYIQRELIARTSLHKISTWHPTATPNCHHFPTVTLEERALLLRPPSSLCPVTPTSNHLCGTLHYWLFNLSAYHCILKLVSFKQLFPSDFLFNRI